MSIASTKTSINSSPVKTTVSQGKKPIGKGKTTKPVDKGKKYVVFSATSSPATTSLTVPMPTLRNKLQDKAKVTVAMILTEDLQSMDQESLAEEQESVVTQESDLEQEDSEEYLTETEDQ